MLHACVQRFDVTENLEKIWHFRVELNRTQMFNFQLVAQLQLLQPLKFV